jgi:hypothetical protein
LPPTPEALERFVRDESPGAYERMVDSYLNANRFGERWAIHWMDIVRYAETKGHEFDYTISGAWQYRDYLIRAFNSDLPYDQLVREHIAGDLIKPRRNSATGTNESRLGTMFYALGEGKHSPVDTRQEEADIIDNILDVTSKAFQGLTVSCARCHDHKFDPISAADYYALYGVMESSRFSPVPATLTLERELALEEAQNLKKYIRRQVAGQWATASAKAAAPAAIPVITVGLVSKEAPRIAPARDVQVLGDFRGSGLAGWKSDGPAFGQKTTLGNPAFDLKTKQIIRLEDGRASSRSLGTGVFGALRSPNFILEKDYIGVRALGQKASIRIVMNNFQLISYPIYQDMDQKVKSDEWKNFIFDVSAWKGNKAYIEILPGVYEAHVYKQPKEAYVEVQYALAFDGEWPELHLPPAADAFHLPTALAAWSASEATPAQVAGLNTLLKNKSLHSQFAEAVARLEDSQRKIRSAADTVFYTGVYDGFGINSPVFRRGNPRDAADPKIPRRFLSAIPVADSVFRSPGSGRKELAESILSPQNPLTSRVMVNRIWHHLFGRGIVESVDNFGLQGKLPTHPELLDYLALKFQREGWSIKQLIRFILLSETFQRSTIGRNEVGNSDPDNLWLAHYPQRRLEAEIIRDGMLTVAGNLDTTMYGPPVPAHITDFMQGRGRPRESGPLDGKGRRSVYQEVRRNFLDPKMLTFDRPIPFSTFGKRNVTNVPAQSLILMNDPFVAQQAEIMAKSLVGNTDASVEERLQRIYVQALSRKASGEEIKQAKVFVQQLAAAYEVKEQDILTSTAIWKDYCHSVFNLKEFIYLI